MALCHDEREHAVGWSRWNPHANKASANTRKKKVEKRVNYLKSLTVHQRLAYERVHLCLMAIGQYHEALGALIPISPDELHEHFPAFAKTLGFKGRFYRKGEDGKCPAILIYLPEEKDAVYFITPKFSYSFEDDSEKKRVHSKTIRKAALKFCKAWLPKWPWDEAKLS